VDISEKRKRLPGTDPLPGTYWDIIPKKTNLNSLLVTSVPKVCTSPDPEVEYKGKGEKKHWL
jgi:hypothetical protein